jgi:hypothetical protein
LRSTLRRGFAEGGTERNFSWLHALNVGRQAYRPSPSGVLASFLKGQGGMRRDSLVGEQVLWRGSPRWIALTGTMRVAFWALTTLAVITMATAVAVASTLAVPVGTMIFFAGWCAMFAMGVKTLPQLWHGSAEFWVTDRRVIWKRGRFARSIERSGITYARIRWYPNHPGVGDLELVRAVPTGALRRRLTLVLRGVDRPDKLWDTIRAQQQSRAPDDLADVALVPPGGVEDDPPPSLGSTFSAPLGRRPLGQRLSLDERVIWSGRPLSTWKRFLPRTRRGVTGAVLGALCAAALARGSIHAVEAAHHVLESGVQASSLGFIALVAALSLSSVLLLGLGVALLWSTVIEPGLLVRHTHYLITSQRVLISQGDEELHLDRSRIVDVIDTPGEAGGHDLFLILDGPQSRALAVSDAFQSTEAPELLPVLRQLPDADCAGRILKPPMLPQLALPQGITPAGGGAPGRPASPSPWPPSPPGP